MRHHRPPKPEPKHPEEEAAIREAKDKLRPQPDQEKHNPEDPPTSGVRETKNS